MLLLLNYDLIRSKSTKLLLEKEYFYSFLIKLLKVYIFYRSKFKNQSQFDLVLKFM